MKSRFQPCLPLLVPALAVFCLATCRAQQVALAGSQPPVTLPSAPTPGPAESSSAYPDPFAVIPAPQPAVHKPPRMNLLDWSGIAAATTLRVLDYTTTEEAMAHPQYYHENILPTALVKNKPAFAAFQAGTVVLNYGAYRYLLRHNLRSLARVSQYLYVSVMAFQVSSNYQTLGKIPGH